MEIEHGGTDELLVERARALDRTAFQELVDRHTPTLRRVVASIVESRSDQDEALQNTLLSAWASLPRFEGRARFGTWMYRIATNAALMVRRAGKHQAQPAPTLAEWERLEPLAGSGQLCRTGCWIERPDEAMQRAQTRALLQRKVMELPSLLREAFLLRYVDDLSIKACGERLGISEAAVKTRTHRACLELRAAIHRDSADLAICRKHGARRPPPAQDEATHGPEPEAAEG